MKPGQRLIIPVHGTGYARIRSSKQAEKDEIHANGDTIKYRAKKGDTLASVAKRFDTSVEELRKLNNIKKRNTLRSGQVILISNKNGDKGKPPDKETHKKTVKGKNESVSAEGRKTYTVRDGDSLGRIAKKNGVSLEKLLEMNRLAREDSIHPGQVIILK